MDYDTDDDIYIQNEDNINNIYSMMQDYFVIEGLFIYNKSKFNTFVEFMKYYSSLYDNTISDSECDSE
jgi:hypothetical protein